MRYLFSTGLIGTISAGVSLLRGTRDAPVTWRAVLAWVSWSLSLCLAIGAAIDMHRENHGILVADDSPLAPRQSKRAKKESKRVDKQLKAAQKR